MDAWSEVAALGEFFAITEYDRDASSGPANWPALAELVDDPAVLHERIAITRTALARSAGIEAGSIEWRVAGSVFELGLFARLVSPLLALALLRAELVEVSLAELRWLPAPAAASSGFSLSVPRDSRRPESADWPAVGSRFNQLVLAGPVARLVSAIGTACSLSSRIGWGNVASAINGAAIVIGGQRPALTAELSALTTAVLGARPLSLADPVVGTGFRRDSCCLLYRATSAGRRAVCVDCVLAGR